MLQNAKLSQRLAIIVGIAVVGMLIQVLVQRLRSKIHWWKATGTVCAIWSNLLCRL